MATKIQIRRDTASDWTSTNPTLAAGEFGWESDTNKFKIGDGATAWTSLAYASDGDTAGITFVGDDSTGTLVSQNETFKVAGTQNVTTAVSGDTLTVTGPDLSSYATGSSTTTFTNKTFDANGTGNSISNIETADIAAGTLVTASEGIGSNDNDTTIPTSAAVKAYADSVGGGGGGSVGDLSIIGSTISAPSNGDLNLTTSGTGYVQLKANGGDFDNYTTQTRYANSNLMYWEDLDHTIPNDRQYKNNIITNIKLTAGQDTSNSNDRWRQIFRNTLDLNGSSTTPTSTALSRGPMGMDSTAEIKNTNSGTTSRLGNASGNQAGVLVDTNGGGNISFEAADSSSTNAGVAGNLTYVELLAGSGTTITIPKAINYYSTGVVKDGAGTASVTDSYAFYANANTGGVVTNEYGFYTADDSMINILGGVTLQNGDIQTQGVSITDNLITTNRSNDSLGIGSNGTGQVNISTTDTFDTNELTETKKVFGANSITNLRGVGMLYKEDDIPEITADTDTRYVHSLVSEWKLATGINTSNSNMRFRNYIGSASLDMNGSSSTNTSFSRGPRSGDFQTTVTNTNSTASTLGSMVGGNSVTYINGEGASGNTTVTNAVAINAALDISADSGITNTVTNAYGYRYGSDKFGSGGTETVTNQYGFYVNSLIGDNKYAFYDATNSLSVFGDIQTQAVSITDNLITTNRSNDDLNIEANGTGQVQIRANGGDLATYSTNTRFNNSNTMYYEDLADTVGDGQRHYSNNLVTNIKLTGSQNSSNSNDRWRQTAYMQLDLNGSSSTATSGQYRSRGPMAFEGNVLVKNISSTAATLGQASGGNQGVSVYPDSSGDLTITNLTGMGTYFELSPSSGDLTITDCVGYESIGIDYYHGSGTTAITDFYHFRAGAHSKTNLTLTNDYAFFTEEATALSQFGAVRLMNQSGDPTGVADTSHIYAKDDGSSSEVYVRDEAGNVTKISPHNEAGEWEYYSKNSKTGKTVRINMEKLVAEVEKLSGKSFIESE